MAVTCSTTKEWDIINIKDIPCFPCSCHNFITSEISGIIPGMNLTQYHKWEPLLSTRGGFGPSCLQNFISSVPLQHIRDFHDSRGTRDMHEAKLINCICERLQLSYTSGSAHALRACVFCGKGLQLKSVYVKSIARAKS